ncbi:hypothetical protein [Devosia sp. SD17-2]|uniref:hypothetical protein n=1 Tax=Devosia sp. SD17-2 TaxID=2976459 RepID=UPI0023D7C3AE|nr:hypothetical protein [Devosia sp. SD17-2]WEJ31978.1 hypothetical protein NYQ88_13825 [Devosia sp. SD17-2]
MKQPFFTWPAQRLDETIKAARDGIRSLPDAQLIEEAEQLRLLCNSPGEQLAEHVLLAVYEAEKDRRTPPAVIMEQIRLFE